MARTAAAAPSQQRHDTAVAEGVSYSRGGGGTGSQANTKHTLAVKGQRCAAVLRGRLICVVARFLHVAFNTVVMNPWGKHRDGPHAVTKNSTPGPSSTSWQMGQSVGCFSAWRSLARLRR